MNECNKIYPPASSVFYFIKTDNQGGILCKSQDLPVGFIMETACLLAYIILSKNGAHFLMIWTITTSCLEKLFLILIFANQNLKQN